MVTPGGPWRGRAPRRAFLARCGVASSAALLAACGSGGNPPATPTTSTDLGGSATVSDIEILNAALDLEHMAVAAYEAALAAGLRGRALETARRFGEQEREHARALERAIADLGGTPNQSKSAGDYGFPKLESEEDALSFGVDVENTAIAMYIDALPKLSDPELRSRTASIVTVEAEHLAVLQAALDRPPVADAFVIGRKSL